MSSDKQTLMASKSDEKVLNVKYHLVEAEEVESTPKSLPSSRGKKKGKINWSQFPLVDNNTKERENPSQVNQHSNSRHRQQRHGGGRGNRFKSNGRMHRRNYDSYGNYFQGVYLPHNDPSTTAAWGAKQVEFYFSPENLVHDTYLRQHMDVDGYVPVAFVASFHAVYSVHQDYQSLLEALRQSEVVEMDYVNEKIRPRNGWKQWLWPNSAGGFGVPSYVKVDYEEKDLEPEQQEQQMSNEHLIQQTLSSTNASRDTLSSNQMEA